MSKYLSKYLFFQGVKCPTADQMVAKSLDNIVGNLWQQRQESSGSSVGNQVKFPVCLDQFKVFEFVVFSFVVYDFGFFNFGIFDFDVFDFSVFHFGVFEFEVFNF